MLLIELFLSYGCGGSKVEFREFTVQRIWSLVNTVKHDFTSRTQTFIKKKKKKYLVFIESGIN